MLVVNNSLSGVTLSLGSLDGTLIWMLSAFAWALYVERCAPYNLRLGALRVMAWTTLIGSLVLLPCRSPSIRSASSPASTTGCWASGSTPPSSRWAWPSSASPPASSGSG